MDVVVVMDSTPDDIGDQENEGDSTEESKCGECERRSRVHSLPGPVLHGGQSENKLWTRKETGPIQS